MQIGTQIATKKHNQAFGINMESPMYSSYIKKLVLLILTILALSSCSTGYQSLGLKGGFSESQLDETNVFTVWYSRNDVTSIEDAVDFTMLRSAELTLMSGFNYFIIVDKNASTDLSRYTTPTTTSSRVYKYANKAYGTPTLYVEQSDLQLRWPFIWGGYIYSNTIICLKDKPADTFVYNAQLIFDSISKKHNIKHLTK